MINSIIEGKELVNPDLQLRIINIHSLSDQIDVKFGSHICSVTADMFAKYQVILQDIISFFLHYDLHYFSLKPATVIKPVLEK